MPLPLPLAQLPAGSNAAAMGVRAGPMVGDLGIGADEARAALAAFHLSCPSLVRRTDASGLTRAEDWREACSAATGWRDSDARGFFARYFETARAAASSPAITSRRYAPRASSGRAMRRRSTAAPPI